MQQHISRFKTFYVVVLLFILAGLSLMLVLPKGALILALNGNNSDFFDVFFKYATWLGEWFGGVLVAILILFGRQLKYFYIYLIAIAISSLSAQLLKTQIFDNAGRPSSEYAEQIHQVEGVELHKHYSFPSGHTTAAFCIFSILAFSSGQRRWQIISALIACLVGISRMYLGQHYLMDVVAGAVLGTMVATITTVILYPGLTRKFGDKRFAKAK